VGAKSRTVHKWGLLHRAMSSADWVEATTEVLASHVGASQRVGTCQVHPARLRSAFEMECMVPTSPQRPQDGGTNDHGRKMPLLHWLRRGLSCYVRLTLGIWRVGIEAHRAVTVGTRIACGAEMV
jgi:hypothetical protein